MRTITFRVEDEEGDELDDIIDEMGMTKQTLFGSFTKVVIRNRRIPYSIEAPRDPFYSEENKKRLRESVKQEKEGKTVSKTLDDLEAMAD